METLTKPKTKVSPGQRVILSEESALQLGRWIEQVRESCPGIRVKKQDLVSWLVSEKDTLTPNDLKSIKERFYDEIELAEWALAQLKAAKARNEKVALSDLLRGGKRTTEGDALPRKARKKSPPALNNEAPNDSAPESQRVTKGVPDAFAT